MDMRRKGASGCCPLCSSAHADLAPVQVLIDAACAHGQRHSFEECFRLLSQARDVEPDNSFVLDTLGHMFEDGIGVAMSIAQAEGLYEEAARVSNGRVGANSLANLYYTQGHVHRAFELCEKAWAGGDIESGVLLASIYTEQCKEQQAHDVLSKAASAGSMEALTHLGVKYKMQGRRSMAVDCYRRAWKAGSVKALFNLGVLHQDGGDLVAARACYEEARKLGLVEATVNLASILQDQGAVHEAEPLLEEARRHGDEDASFNLACLRMKQGDPRSAHDLFQEARSRGHKEAAVNLAMVDFELGDFNAAQATLLEESEMGNTAMLNATIARRCNTPCLLLGDFAIGDRVLIHGLQSSSGLQFNFHFGTVRKVIPASGRVGVAIDGVEGTRALKPENLVPKSIFQDFLPARTTSIAGACTGSTSSQGNSTPIGPFGVGDRVWIYGLPGSEMNEMNGRLGTVLKPMSSSGRYAVDVDGTGVVLAVDAECLAPESFQRLVDYDPLWDTVWQDDERAEVSSVVAADTKDANAQLSSALIESRRSDLAASVALLCFSRSPRSFRTLLAEASGLAPCREALIQGGYALELRSGAKMLVKPEHYDPALEALRLAGWSLSHQHVVVEVELAEVVTDLMKRLPGRESVRPRGQQRVPLAFAAASLQCNSEITVTKTFINISVPSSLVSAEGSGQRTQSTTDADKRKGKNARKRNARAKGHSS